MLEHWYAALNSSRGVVIRVSDPERARQKLYAARREAADPALDGFALVISPTAPDEIWIVRKKNGST